MYCNVCSRLKIILVDQYVRSGDNLGGGLMQVSHAIEPCIIQCGCINAIHRVFAAPKNDKTNDMAHNCAGAQPGGSRVVVDIIILFVQREKANRRSTQSAVGMKSEYSR